MVKLGAGDMNILDVFIEGFKLHSLNVAFQQWAFTGFLPSSLFFII